MSRYSKTNFSDFKTLHTYNKPVLGIPAINPKDQVQLVPTWLNTNYKAPNYESLNVADSYQAYAPINASYADDGVKYIPRNCIRGGGATPMPTMMPTSSPM